jgi:hypothetical protein
MKIIWHIFIAKNYDFILYKDYKNVLFNEKNQF